MGGREDKDIVLEDGTTKIFLNTAGDMNDVSDELRVFLDYVSGRKPDDSFIRELEEAVEEARKNRKWRHEYMTLLMRDQENVEKGLEKGLEEGLEKGIIGMVSALRDLNIPNDTILQKIQEKFDFTREEAERYVK